MQWIKSVPSGKLIVGVSGGIDSMVLADALHRAGHFFTIAHVDHGLRPESKEEASFVKEWASARALPVRLTELDWRSSRATQEACRMRRYGFFERVMEEEQGDVLLLAHHLDDQLETMLVQYVRGEARIDGMPKERAFAGGMLHRPMLEVPRADIEAYAEFHDVEWREDASNTKRDYLRNRLRLDLLPIFEAIRPGYGKQTAGAAAERRAVEREHAAFVNEWAERNRTTNGYSLEEIRRLPSDFRRHLLRVLLPEEKLGKTEYDDWETFLSAAGASRSYEIGRRFLTRSYGWVKIDEVVPISLKPFEINAAQGTYRYGSKSFRLNKGAAGLPMSSIRFPLLVRSPLPGDRIELSFGMKKVSRILIDAKVPSHEREQVPVLADATGRVLAVIGHRVAQIGSFELLHSPGLMIEWT